MRTIFKSLKNVFHYIQVFLLCHFFFIYFFYFLIFTVINFTNFNFWIIKILVLSPKQSKRMSFSPKSFSWLLLPPQSGRSKMIFPLQKRARLQGFSLLAGCRESPPTSQKFAHSPPPNSYSLPTLGKSLISGVLSQFFCQDS